MAIREQYDLGLRDPPGYSLVGPSHLFLSEYPAQTSALAGWWPAIQLPPSTGKIKYGQPTIYSHRITAPTDGVWKGESK